MYLQGFQFGLHPTLANIGINMSYNSNRLTFGVSGPTTGALRNSTSASPGIECVSGDGTQWGNFYTQGSVYSAAFRTLGGETLGGLSGDLYVGYGPNVGGFRTHKLKLTSDSSFTALATIYGTNGVPSNSLGSDGDFCFNSAGIAGSRLYHKVTGAWVGIL